MVSNSGRWNGVTFADLPNELLSHQQDSGPFVGSFFWRFDHEDGDSATGDTHGFTEDSIFGALGLESAFRSGHTQVADGLTAVRKMLPMAVEPVEPAAGSVWGHLWLASEQHPFYAGRMLMGLVSVHIEGDYNVDGFVDEEDLAIFVQNWLEESDCRLESSGDSIVNFNDFALGLARNWGE